MQIDFCTQYVNANIQLTKYLKEYFCYHLYQKSAENAVSIQIKKNQYYDLYFIVVKLVNDLEKKFKLKFF